MRRRMVYMIGVYISVRAGQSAYCCARYSLRETYGALVGKTMVLGAGGSEPLKTAPRRFLHVRLAMNNTAAARSNRAKVAPTLTPAVAPFERPEELLPIKAELDVEVVSVVSDVVVRPTEVVGPAEVIDVVGTFEPAELLDAIGEVEPSTALDVVGVLEFVDQVELVGVLDVDVVVCVVCDFLNGAALLGLLESFAATTSSAGHSVSQALEEQHPKKGLSKSKQVYQAPLGSRHSWSVMLAPLPLLKLEYRTSSSGQYLGRRDQR
jgi:hypothetical protein